MTASYDVVVAGAGTAGIPCAVEAARQGARVLLVDKADRVGGTLHISGGHLAGAGTRRQRERGIDDHPDAHYADIMRIGRGQADPAILRRAVDTGAATIDWLDDLGFEQADTSPRVVYGHEPYGTARTHHGTDEARSILRLLTPLLEDAVRGGAVDLWLSTRLVGLIRNGRGAVAGVTVDRGGARVDVNATATVLATGGYGASAALFEELEGRPLFSVAAETSTGDGLAIAREEGAAVVGRDAFLPTFGGLPAGPQRTHWMPRLHLVAAERPPWEIYVDREGQRFVAEDERSIDEKERRLLAAVPDLTFHVVIDARGLRDGAPLVLGGHDLRDMAGRWEGVVSAATLEELAVVAGIDASGLIATVADYNRRLAAGEPDPLGRRHRPAPIAEPPFYAARNHGTAVITFAGVAVDDTFAVLDVDRRRIPGLYAVGEILGCAATMGNAFCGGMTLTPALAFGRDLGARLGASIPEHTHP